MGYAVSLFFLYISTRCLTLECFISGNMVTFHDRPPYHFERLSLEKMHDVITQRAPPPQKWLNLDLISLFL